jgi:neutral ceramidase
MKEPHLEAVKKYSDELVEQIVTLVGKSLERLEPADVYAQNGVARFQVNRRNNNAQHLQRLTELSGPMDPAVPVIKVVNRSGDLMAVAFGYACHPTVLGDYEWSGDYPGFAQMELEKLYPGTTALFFQGAGADQNPLPRHTVPLATQYGKTLAAAVERVLSEDMRQLEPKTRTAYAEVELPLTKAPTSAELTDYINKSSGYQQQWAKRLLARLKAGEKFETSYPYPVQVWNLGGQPIFTLGGELVVEYAIELKRIFGQHAFVMGYSNDVMSYIPTTTILREGGYEGATAQMVYGLPSTWGSDSEIMILHRLVQLAKEAEVPQPEEKLF